MMSIKDCYPVVLKASHIAEILDVSEGTAYNLMKEETFPVIRFGRCKRVLRDEFYKWLEIRSEES